MSTHSEEPTLQSTAEKFTARFGAIPRLFCAPGRINLIGEHTDYNDGFVMPAAIQFATTVAIAHSSENNLRIYSDSFSEEISLPLNALDGPTRNHWSDYSRGVAAMLQSTGHKLCGANLFIHSTVPIGGGMSSSAAIEVSTAIALAAISGFEIPTDSLPRLCQLAEQKYTGTQCGIMDQFISVHARAGHALMLDCRSLQYQLHAVPNGALIAVCNTGVKHALAGGEYNLRRQSCESGVAILQNDLPSIKALRDVSLDDFNRLKQNLPGLILRRCRHVITENNRVEEAVAALHSSDLHRFGQLMYASHASLRDDYEVSCPELDILVEAARDIEGVYGARMMGGGFGGCTVNLIAAESAERFKSTVAERYQKQTGKSAAIYFCTLSDGAKEITAQLS
jgi:galactokinase